VGVFVLHSNDVGLNLQVGRCGHFLWYIVDEMMEIQVRKNRKLIKKVRILGYFSQCIPFVRCIVLNGSLAFGTATADSDIDILVIGKHDRLFTLRFIIVALGLLGGTKRPKNENKRHAGKFCFNYFLADNYLKIPTGRGKAIDQYCSNNYSQSILVWGKESIFNKFFAVNGELFRKATIKNKKLGIGNNFPLKIFHPLFLVGRTLEFLLNGWWGNRLEKILKFIQVMKIESDPRTKKYPHLIIYNNLEMRFHPPKNNN
jgi:predicted nucleotidyltransferase